MSFQSDQAASGELHTPIHKLSFSDIMAISTHAIKHREPSRNLASAAGPLSLRRSTATLADDAVSYLDVAFVKVSEVL